ncbi:hypothetical protein [Micromonospora sp. WMMD710]|uniref:hypothetical protein n=1 Tax=Micromonospora sp. WMMD710 TaxID=3016085 RepID=UPI00241700E2|nr:hypothetical protein [Micromonospora sp. WMMD710]MDG4760812.1 hypothetical protein [Micromonospora sp. WMMD710]
MSRVANQAPGSMPADHAALTSPNVVAEPPSVSRMKKTSITLMPPGADPGVVIRSVSMRVPSSRR